MKYELSEHAQLRIAERSIETIWLERVIENPQLTEPDEDDPALQHRLATIAEKDYRVLRVVATCAQRR